MWLLILRLSLMTALLSFASRHRQPESGDFSKMVFSRAWGRLSALAPFPELQVFLRRWGCGNKFRPLADAGIGAASHARVKRIVNVSVTAEQGTPPVAPKAANCPLPTSPTFPFPEAGRAAVCKDSPARRRGEPVCVCASMAVCQHPPVQIIHQNFSFAGFGFDAAAQV